MWRKALCRAGAAVLRVYRNLLGRPGGYRLLSVSLDGGDFMKNEAFLAALQAAPGDDTARLVYADWLDEQGLPPAESFSGVGCQLSVLDPVDHDQRSLLLAKLRVASHGLDREWLVAVSGVLLEDIRPHSASEVSGSEAVGSRERAYLDILHRGLVLVRNLAHGGQTELCRIEADHLHNIPSLLGETNECRHVFYIYILQERGLLAWKRLRGARGY